MSYCLLPQGFCYLEITRYRLGLASDLFRFLGKAIVLIHGLVWAHRQRHQDLRKPARIDELQYALYLYHRASLGSTYKLQGLLKQWGCVTAPVVLVRPLRHIWLFSNDLARKTTEGFSH
jgi:hypothetical protein